MTAACINACLSMLVLQQMTKNCRVLHTTWRDGVSTLLAVMAACHQLAKSCPVVIIISELQMTHMAATQGCL